MVGPSGRALLQAEKFGAKSSVPCVAESLREEAGHLVVRHSDGTEVAGFYCSLLATSDPA